MSAQVRSTLNSARAGGGQASARLPVAGKIRPGIKVLTKKAQAMPKAQETYDQGLAAGASFDDIEKALKKLPNCPAYPLTPRNAPYFRVVPDDFTTPGAAEAILAKYGSEDGYLYTFPVLFPSDDMDLVFQEKFEAWKASELSYWSEVDPGTGELVCKKRADIKPDRSRRKRWGGRPVETVGPCDPNACETFGAGHCMHHGTLSFYIPGCPGVGLIQLDFTSIYASLGITEVLDMVQAGLGHIKGTHQGQPIFWISKKRQEVSRVDWEKGKAERSDQYIISIEARGLDMAQVFAEQEMGTAPQLAAPAPAAAGALPDLSNEERTAAGAGGPMTEAAGDTVSSAEDAPAPEAAQPTDIKTLRKQANDLTTELQLNVEAFASRQAADFGADWSKNADALKQVIARLEQAKATGDFSDLTAPAETGGSNGGKAERIPF